jgi:hypothetical protein
MRTLLGVALLVVTESAAEEPWRDGKITEVTQSELTSPIAGQMIITYTVQSGTTRYVAYEMVAISAHLSPQLFKTGDAVRVQEHKKTLVVMDSKGKKRSLTLQKKTQ